MQVEYWLSLLKVVTIIVCLCLPFIISFVLLLTDHRFSSSSVLLSTVAEIQITSILEGNTGISETLPLSVELVDLRLFL